MSAACADPTGGLAWLLGSVASDGASLPGVAWEVSHDNGETVEALQLLYTTYLMRVHLTNLAAWCGVENWHPRLEQRMMSRHAFRRTVRQMQDAPERPEWAGLSGYHVDAQAAELFDR